MYRRRLGTINMNGSGLSGKEVLLCLSTTVLGLGSTFLIAVFLPSWGIFVIIFGVVPAMLVAITKI